MVVIKSGILPELEDAIKVGKVLTVRAKINMTEECASTERPC